MKDIKKLLRGYQNTDVRAVDDSGETVAYYFWNNATQSHDEFDAESLKNTFKRKESLEEINKAVPTVQV